MNTSKIVRLANDAFEFLKSPQSKLDSALFDACKHGQEQEALEAIAKGANVNSTDSNQWSPLQEASFFEMESICKILLDAKADVNYKNKSGNTSLHYAARHGSNAICSLLVDHQADPSVKNFDGKTPQQIAEENNYHETAKLIESFLPRKLAEDEESSNDIESKVRKIRL